MPPPFLKKNCLVNSSLSLATQKAAVCCFSFPCVSYAINWGTHAQQTVFFLNQTFAKCVFKKTQPLPRSQTGSNLSLIFKLFFFSLAFHLFLFLFLFLSLQLFVSRFRFRKSILIKDRLIYHNRDQRCSVVWDDN
jgi:hypothetical protein